MAGRKRKKISKEVKAKMVQREEERLRKLQYRKKIKLHLDAMK